uniref:Uncharacterized protein n=1 Tax=Anguilla anguilla TaxID=7936 RepID=A0A0E9XR70_ANGAN
MPRHPVIRRLNPVLTPKLKFQSYRR